MVPIQTLRVILFVLAFCLFAISAYLSTALPEKLTRAAFAIVVLAWIIP
jgi:type IV secretory pathway TrbL component